MHWHTDFPYRPGSDPMPAVLHATFRTAVGVSVCAPAVFFLRRAGNDGFTFGLFGYTAASPLVMLLAIPAICASLAYGVWAQRRYARFLAAGSLAAAVLAGAYAMLVARQVRLDALFEMAAALGSIRYLLRNADVIAYYARTRA